MILISVQMSAMGTPGKSSGYLLSRGIPVFFFGQWMRPLASSASIRSFVMAQQRDAGGVIPFHS